MRIHHTQQIDKKISELTECAYINSQIGHLIEYIIANELHYDENILDDVTKADRYFGLKDSYSLTDDQILIFAQLIGVADDILDYGWKSIPFDTMVDIAKEGKVVKSREWRQSDPYLSDIKVPDISTQNIRYSHDKFLRFEINNYDVSGYKDGIVVPRFCTFDHAFRYPRLDDEKSIWMSITPTEIVTMKKPVSEASGKVLTLGCGLGYYAYLVSEKADVDSVAIVEKDPHVIQLFKDNILPQFENKDKITVIETDAIDYMKNLDDGVYNYCFTDIWRSNIDTHLYMRLKSICERRFSKTHMSYWIEKGIINNLLGNVQMLLVSEAPEYGDEINFRIGDTINNDPATNENWSFISDLLENEEVNNAEDIDMMLTPGWLLNKINELFKQQPQS